MGGPISEGMTTLANLEPDRPAERDSIDLAIGGMTCASCAGRVERALRRVPGVLGAEVNLATERARVVRTEGTAGLEALAAAVRKAGYQAAPADAAAAAAKVEASRREFRHLLAAAVLSLPLLAGMAGHLAGLPWMLPPAAQFALASIVQFWLGGRFYVAGWKAVRAGPATWICWWRSAPPPPGAVGVELAGRAGGARRRRCIFDPRPS